MKKQEESTEKESNKLTTYLYIKTSPLGLKYLGKTVKDPFTYMGSGKVWKRHIKKHKLTKSDIVTEVVFTTTNLEELVREGIRLSRLYNVVELKEWANLREETGDGGDTSKFIDYANLSRDYKKMVVSRDLQAIGKKCSDTKRQKSTTSLIVYCSQCSSPIWRSRKNIENKSNVFCTTICSGKFTKGRTKPEQSEKHKGEGNPNSKKVYEYATGIMYSTVKGYMKIRKIKNYYQLIKLVNTNQIKVIK